MLETLPRIIIKHSLRIVPNGINVLPKPLLPACCNVGAIIDNEGVNVARVLRFCSSIDIERK